MAPGRTIDDVMGDVIDKVRETSEAPLEEFLFEGYVQREIDSLDIGGARA